MKSDALFVEDNQRIRPKNSEVFRLWCDNSKIEELTGYRTQITVREGLIKTIDWLLAPENFKRYKSEIYNV